MPRLEDLHDQIDRFFKEVEKRPTTPEPLEALVAIEDIIKQIKAGVKWTNENIDHALGWLGSPMFKKNPDTPEDPTTIYDLLDLISIRVEKAINSDQGTTLEEFLKSLGVEYEKVDDIIVDTDPSRAQITPGSGKGLERKELIEDKLKVLLHSVLYKKGVFTTDVCIVDGALKNNMMKEESYLCIEIPIINRTIMLNRKYGEASFVLPGIHDRSDLFESTKDDLIFEYFARRVVFNEKDVKKWVSEMQQYLFDEDFDEAKRINIQQYNLRRRFIYAFKKKFPTPEDWMDMTHREKLKIQGKGLRAISTIFNVKGNPADNSRIMAQLGKKIYGEGHSILECELWGQADWIKEIKILVSTPEDWMDMTHKEKAKLKIQGKGLNAISTIFNVKGNPADNSRIMAQLGKKIYGPHPVFDRYIEEEN